MKLVLPLPPSINAAYANNRRAGKGRYKTAAYRAWLKAADASLLMQKRGLVPVTGPASIVIRLPEGMRGDASNRVKLPEDYLVSRGLTSDDKNNRSVTAMFSEHVEPGFCEIEVTSCGESGHEQAA